MSLQVCETCRFWDLRTGECAMVEWASTKQKPAPNGMILKADAADDHGLTAAVFTGPQFSCVQWSAKP